MDISRRAFHCEPGAQQKGSSCALGEGASAERPSPLRRCGRDVSLSKLDRLRFGVGEGVKVIDAG
jgi:hypothetical protein